MSWESDYVWAVGDEPPTASQVKKAGDRIRRAVESGGAPSPDDLGLLDRFRAWHGLVHNQLQLRLGSALAQSEVTLGEGELAIAGRPLKTREAIVAKLVREKSRLNRIQDIVGARVVVPNREAQEAALAATLDEFKDESPVVAKDTRDEPDALGYRGLHVVVQLDGRYAEIQIRTAAQGLWAQVVEKLDEVGGTDLKHGSGPESTLQWLQRFSDDLNRVERGEQVSWATVLEGVLAIMIVLSPGEKEG